MAEAEPMQGEPDGGTPTITTVARLANVSIASASRALNGIRTSPETLARVTEAAEAIGYVPNAAARSLRSRRTGQIVFAMPDVGNPVYTTMVASIQDATRESGFRLMLHSTGADTEDELGIVRDLRHRFADGLILATIHLTEAHVEELRSAAPLAVELVDERAEVEEHGLALASPPAQRAPGSEVSHAGPRLPLAGSRHGGAPSGSS